MELYFCSISYDKIIAHVIHESETSPLHHWHNGLRDTVEDKISVCQPKHTKSNNKILRGSPGKCHLNSCSCLRAGKTGNRTINALYVSSNKIISWLQEFKEFLIGWLQSLTERKVLLSFWVLLLWHGCKLVQIAAMRINPILFFSETFIQERFWVWGERAKLVVAFLRGHYGPLGYRLEPGTVLDGTKLASGFLFCIYIGQTPSQRTFRKLICINTRS